MVCSRCWSGGFVDNRPVHGVGGFCTFLVACCWNGAIPTAVVTIVATRPAVVLAFEGHAAWGGGGSAQVGELLGAVADLGEGSNEVLGGHGCCFV
jgi:hypothetical protein